MPLAKFNSGVVKHTTSCWLYAVKLASRHVLLVVLLSASATLTCAAVDENFSDLMFLDSEDPDEICSTAAVVQFSPTQPPWSTPSKSRTAYEDSSLPIPGTVTPATTLVRLDDRSSAEWADNVSVTITLNSSMYSPRHAVQGKQLRCFDDCSIDSEQLVTHCIPQHRRQTNRNVTKMFGFF